MSTTKGTTRCLAVAATAAAVLGGAIPSTAFADGECAVDEPAIPLFEEHDGDRNRYFPAPGGTFEGPQVAEVTGETRLVTDQHGIGQVGRTALAMGSGATVTTGSFCVDVRRQHVRFLMKRTSAGGSIKVEAVPVGGDPIVIASASSATNTWVVSAQIPLAAPLGVTESSLDVRLRLTTTGSWIVDGIVVDPYRR